MKDKLITKINSFFQERNYEILEILKNSNKNADYNYYIIHKGNQDVMFSEKDYSEFIKFQKENDLKMLTFCEKNIKSIDELIKEFEKEGFEKIFYSSKII